LLFSVLWARYGAETAVGLFGLALAILIVALGQDGDHRGWAR
jgi:hypothetical protein